MFENGSEILKFDCHLHTVSDKEFKYDGETDKFVKDYVDKLQIETLGVGIITNHNNLCRNFLCYFNTFFRRYSAALA